MKKNKIEDPWEKFFQDLFGPGVLFGGLVSLAIFSLPLVGIGIGIGYWIWG